MSLLVLCLAAGVALPAQTTWGVSGRGLETHPGLDALRRRAGEAVPEAIGSVEAALGIRPGALSIRWVLDLSPPPATPPAAVPALAAGSTRFDGGTVVVTLPARKHLRQSSSLEQVIAHEAVHAVMASALGSHERYLEVPRWFREGTALLVAGEGMLMVREAIAQEVFAGRPASSFLRGVALVERPAAAAAEGGFYAEAYLAVRWLEERVGKGGLKAIAARVGRGEALEAVVREVPGISADGFGAASLAFAAADVARLLPGEREAAFRDAMAASSRGDLDRARLKWGQLLAEDRSGALAPTLRFLLAKDALEAESASSRAAGRAHLEALLALPGESWRAEGLQLLGECRWQAGERAAAREAWEQVLEVYGEEAGPALKARKALQR